LPSRSITSTPGWPSMTPNQAVDWASVRVRDWCLRAVPSRKFNSLADLLGQPYEKSFGPTDVAEPIGVFLLDHFAAYKLRAVLAEAGERIVDVVHGEHDA
jgi:hypothetical protein